MDSLPTVYNSRCSGRAAAWQWDEQTVSPPQTGVHFCTTTGKTHVSEQRTAGWLENHNTSSTHHTWNAWWTLQLTSVVMQSASPVISSTMQKRKEMRQIALRTFSLTLFLDSTVNKLWYQAASFQQIIDSDDRHSHNSQETARSSQLKPSGSWVLQQACIASCMDWENKCMTSDIYTKDPRGGQKQFTSLRHKLCVSQGMSLVVPMGKQHKVGYS